MHTKAQQVERNGRVWTIQKRKSSVSKSTAAVDGFVAVLKALPKAERDAVIVRIAQDSEFAEDILDLAVIASRRKEASRPFRKNLSKRNARLGTAITQGHRHGS
jgi:hypothetical protein